MVPHQSLHAVQEAPLLAALPEHAITMGAVSAAQQPRLLPTCTAVAPRHPAHGTHHPWTPPAHTCGEAGCAAPPGKSLGTPAAASCSQARPAPIAFAHDALAMQIAAATAANMSSTSAARTPPFAPQQQPTQPFAHASQFAHLEAAPVLAPMAHAPIQALAMKQEQQQPRLPQQWPVQLQLQPAEQQPHVWPQQVRASNSALEQIQRRVLQPQTAVLQPPSLADPGWMKPQEMGAAAEASMRDGSRAQEARNFALARKHYIGAYHLSKSASSQVAGAYMADLMGDAHTAAAEYSAVLQRANLDSALRAHVLARQSALVTAAQLSKLGKPPPLPRVPKGGGAPRSSGAPSQWMAAVGGAASRLSLVLEAAYGVHDADGILVLDKRQLVVRLTATDSAGLPAKALEVSMRLVYDDMSLLPPEVDATAVSGTLGGMVVTGDTRMRIKVTPLSSNHSRRRFRLAVAARDQSVACASEPFSIVYSTSVKRESGAGLAPQIRASHALQAAKAHVAERPPAAQLDRRRYFRNAELGEATATCGPSGHAPLSLCALRLCDRLAAIVTQQITQRAMAAARKRAPDMPPALLPPPKRPAAETPPLPFLIPSTPSPTPPTCAGGSVRRMRCGTCVGCARAEDCGACRNCLDKVKFGGTNTRKAACIYRACVVIQSKPAERPPASTDEFAISPQAAAIWCPPIAPNRHTPLAGVEAGRAGAAGHDTLAVALSTAAAASAVAQGTCGGSAVGVPASGQAATPAHVAPAAGVALRPTPLAAAGVVPVTAAPPAALAPAPPAPRVPRPRWSLQAKDVVAAVRRPGNFDFLYLAQVVKRWEPAATEAASDDGGFEMAAWPGTSMAGAAAAESEGEAAGVANREADHKPTEGEADGAGGHDGGAGGESGAGDEDEAGNEGRAGGEGGTGGASWTGDGAEAERFGAARASGTAGDVGETAALNLQPTTAALIGQSQCRGAALGFIDAPAIDSSSGAAPHQTAEPK